MNNAAGSLKQRKALLTAVIGCAAFFAGFVASWSVLTRKIEESKDYTVSVARHLADGDVKRAVQVAQIASERNPIDPVAANLYARTLMAAGRTEEALGQYRYLFGIDHCPNPDYSRNQPSDAPPTLPTQRPYFYPQARLAMGKYYADRGETVMAVENAELARAFGQAARGEYQPFLYELYGALGAWGRAFDHATPTRTALRTMRGEALLAFARYSASRGAWLDCRAGAEALVENGEDTPEANLWLGRALLAAGQPEPAAHALSKAMDLGQPDAPFFLGLAKEALGPNDGVAEVYLCTATESLYRPFSLAKAIEHLEAEAREGQTENPAQLEQLEQELRTYFEEPLPLPRPFIQEPTAVRPLGFNLEPGRRDAQSPFLLQILWLDERGDNDREREEFSLDLSGTNQILLAHGQRILELRFVTNLVPFGNFEQLDASARALPGWPELYRRPKPPRGEKEFNLVRKETGVRLRIRSYADDVITEIRTVFVHAGTARHYLLAVRACSDPATLYAGWNWYDSRDSLVDNHNVFNQVKVKGMRWRTEYRRRRETAMYVQAIAGIFRDLGVAEFDAVVIVPLDPPKPL